MSNKLLTVLATFMCVLAAGADVTPVKDFNLEKVRQKERYFSCTELIVSAVVLFFVVNMNLQREKIRSHPWMGCNMRKERFCCMWSNTLKVTSKCIGFLLLFLLIYSILHVDRMCDLCFAVCNLKLIHFKKQIANIFSPLL